MIVGILAVILCILLILLFHFYLEYKTAEGKVQRLTALSEDEQMMREALSRWVLIEYERKDIAQLLISMGFRRVGIYRHSFMGWQLERELKASQIELKGIVTPTECPKDLDAVIVTNICDFQEIKQHLKNTGVEADIISLDTLLYQM